MEGNDLTETDRTNEHEAAAHEIATVLSSLARRYSKVDDAELDEEISKRLPEPPVTDPRPVSTEPAVVHSVSVQGIRSFGPEQTLHLSEGLTIVYAGNGKGKTSLTDAFELVTRGSTTRKVGLPNAATEVKDKDHITHRTHAGTPDLAHPPRVAVRYRRGDEMLGCEWVSFEAPAPRHPDLQVLPRRLLRALVNAKRTERIEPLGAALGLAETSASWTAIAKALGAKSTEASQDGESYLQLLAGEVTLDRDKDAQIAALTQWAREQKFQPESLPGTPSASSWHELAEALETATSKEVEGTRLESQLTSLLTAFLSVAEPGTNCPACAQAQVPQARLDEVEALLAGSEAAKAHAAGRVALVDRQDTLAANVEAWLEVTAPRGRSTAPELPEWGAALAALREVLTQKPHHRDAQWTRHVASALEELDAVHARLVHSSGDRSSLDRRRAVEAITADADGTLRALHELEFRRTALSPLLKRAQAMTRALLVRRVREEFAGLADPINDWLEILGPEGTPPRISLAATPTTGRPSLDVLVADLPDGAKAPHAAGYFSDAQLDMLGMAAHMARIERDHAGSTIVIDDPSDILDSTSRKALAGPGIARLLEHGDRAAHQVLVLTHDDQLVRDLWDAHRHRSPTTVQDSMEIHRSEEGEDSFSVLTSRTTADAVARARALANEHWQEHQDRLWFRAALASHTRQATEMCAKDVDTLLGPAGMDLHPSNRVPRESDELGPVSDRVRATLRETTASWCQSGRHNVARSRIGELMDLFSKSSTQFLNPGAHADVVLPEANSSKEALLRLEDAATLLAAPDGRPRSSWTTRSQLADLLRSNQKCSQCEAPG